MSFETLMKLAGINDNSELMTELGLIDDNLPGNEFSAVLLELQEEERKDAMKNAAKDVIELLKHANTSTELLVSRIRVVRQTEKELLAYVKKVQAAREYGAETSNYIPLVIALNFDDRRRQSHLLTQFGDKAVIPEGWKPKTGAKPVARTASKK